MRLVTYVLASIVVAYVVLIGTAFVGALAVFLALKMGA